MTRKTTDAPQEPEEGTQAVSEKPQDPPQEPQEDPQEPEDGGEPENGNREAAKYRRRLRETETERDSLTTELAEVKDRLAAAQSIYLAQALSNTNVSHDAFRAAGYDAESILDQEGKLDQNKLNAAVRDTEARFGRVRQVGVVPTAGTAAPTQKAKTSWSDVLSDD